MQNARGVTSSGFTVPCCKRESDLSRMRTPRLLAVMTAAVMLAGTCMHAHAEELPVPTGEVVLTVSGQIQNTNMDDTAQFDRQMLEDLGLVEIITHTPWRAGEMTFSGVPLEALLRMVGAEGKTITAIALDDYQSEIPFSDAWNTGMILALKLNGHDISVRNKGPIFMIYPYDSWEGYHTQTYYSRSVWQLTQLIIE